MSREIRDLEVKGKGLIRGGSSRMARRLGGKISGIFDKRNASQDKRVLRMSGVQAYLQGRSGNGGIRLKPNPTAPMGSRERSGNGLRKGNYR